MSDDFSAKTKDILAKRVGLRCSRPDCFRSTIGPHSDPSQLVNVGVACHITAASPGGPRYNPNLTADERKAVENGIWLCQTHAKLIDNDVIEFTVDVLLKWKSIAEATTRQELEAMTSTANRDLLATNGRLTSILFDAIEHFDKVSDAGTTDPPDTDFAERARQLEQRISDVVIDALALKANPLFEEADRLETAIAVKTMRAALRLRGFQYQHAYVDYDQDIFRAYIPARQNEVSHGSVGQARADFVEAFDQFERLSGLRTLRSRSTA